MRLMPGWAGPGKPAFQADAEAALAAKQAAQESAQALDSSDATAQEANSNDAPSSSSAAPSSTGAASSTEAERPPRTTAHSDAASAPASGSDDQTGVSHLIQNMTDMFEQRRQIQAAQNHPAQDQQPNPN